MLDRWSNHTTGSITSTVQHLSGFPTTNEKYVRTVATNTGTGYMRMFQRVEGNFEGRELTFSAWVRSNRQTRLLTIATGAWVSNDTSARHSGNGQWEKLTLTITAGNFTSPHFVISNNAVDHGTTSVVTGDYFEVANCQLEEGKIATPFEYRSYGEELALCERYFQKVPIYNESIMGQAYSTTAARFPIQLPVQMRATPTLTVPVAGTSGDSFKPLTNTLSWPGGTGANAGTALSNRHFYITCTSYSGLVAGNASTIYSASNNIFITASAEL
jgi:hypothetical protein